VGLDHAAQSTEIEICGDDLVNFRESGEIENGGASLAPASEDKSAAHRVGHA
jgi:hypothetical protein